jgi:hypothetical protein
MAENRLIPDSDVVVPSKMQSLRKLAPGNVNEGRKQRTLNSIYLLNLWFLPVCVCL